MTTLSLFTTQSPHGSTVPLTMASRLLSGADSLTATSDGLRFVPTELQHSGENSALVLRGH